jgi:hypothetical protein
MNVTRQTSRFGVARCPAFEGTRMGVARPARLRALPRNAFPEVRA